MKRDFNHKFLKEKNVFETLLIGSILVMYLPPRKKEVLVKVIILGQVALFIISVKGLISDGVKA